MLSLTLFQRVRKVEHGLTVLNNKVDLMDSNLEKKLDMVLANQAEEMLILKQILAAVTPPPPGTIKKQRILFSIPME